MAETMQALATGSRVRIIACLREAPRSVGELADALEMEQSPVSHQLRVLQQRGLVVGERVGRRTFYALHNSHVGDLLEEAVFHVQHLRLGLALLKLPTLQPDQVTDSLHAYQLATRGNSLRVMAEAVRWGKRGARAHTINPGIIFTPLARDELTGPRGEIYRRMIELSPAGRGGTPDEGRRSHRVLPLWRTRPQ